jgi:hypothetical protein
VKIRTIVQPVRKCGKRKELGCYLVSREGTEDGALPHYVVADTPIPVQRKPHRSPVAVDGDAILARRPEEEWLAGSSARSAEKRSGDQWAMDVFGMTLTKRLTTGDCSGLKSADEAILHLSEKIVYSRKVSEYVRKLSMNGVAEMPALPSRSPR